MDDSKLKSIVKPFLITAAVLALQAVIIADVYWTTYRPENEYMFRSGRNPGDHIVEGVLIESILVWGFISLCLFLYYLYKNPHPSRKD